MPRGDEYGVGDDVRNRGYRSTDGMERFLTQRQCAISMWCFVASLLSCNVHFSPSDGKMVVCYLCEQLGPQSLMCASVSEQMPAHCCENRPHPASGQSIFILLAYQC